ERGLADGGARIAVGVLQRRVAINVAADRPRAAGVGGKRMRKGVGRGAGGGVEHADIRIGRGWNATLTPEGGIAAGGTGEDWREGRELAAVDRAAVAVLDRENDRRLLPCRDVGRADDREAEAFELLRLLGNDVRSLDRGVELLSAVGDVARGARTVVGLDAAFVVGAGDEVHVVVAGAAGRAARVREVDRRLRRLRAGVRSLMAVLAVENVLREDDGRAVVDRLPEADDLVGRARLDARPIV